MTTAVLDAQQQKVAIRLNGSPFNRDSIDGVESVYIEACVKGNVNAVKELLDIHGAAKLSRVKDIMGFSGMHIACASGHEKLLELFIRYRIDVNMNENGLQSSFQVASILRHINIAKTLIFYNANINIKDCYGKTGLQYLTAELAELLIEYHKTMNPWNRRKNFITTVVENGYYPLEGRCQSNKKNLCRLNTIETVICNNDLFRLIVSYI